MGVLRPCRRDRPLTYLQLGQVYSEQDPHWYTRRVKESLHIGFHLNIINSDSEIKIPEVHDQNIRKKKENGTAADR